MNIKRGITSLYRSMFCGYNKGKLPSGTYSNWTERRFHWVLHPEVTF